MGAQNRYSPRNRAERVITAGRLFLATFLALAIFLDPLKSADSERLVRWLASAYLVYSVAVALLVSQRRATTRTLSFGTHATDLAVFAAFMYLTDTSDSPFFVYFIFATLAGAIRWHGVGALLTGIGGLAVYVVLTLSEVFFEPSADFELGRFIGRSAQLAVVTGLVAYMAAYHHRLQREIAQLAAWPRMPVPEHEALPELLTYASDVLRAPGVVFVWEEGEEPSLRMASRQHGQVTVTRFAPDAFGAIVAEPLASTAFLCSNIAAELPIVVFRVDDGYDVWRGDPLDPRLRERFKADSVVAVRLLAGPIKGWLFVLGRKWISSDDLLLAEVVSRLVAGALELRMALEQLRETAASEERLRLSRELHDGVLQSLTAASLQTQRARTILSTDTEEAVRRLKLVEETILAAHQALRVSIWDLRPGALDRRAPVDCGEQVRQEAMRIARQWEVAVHVEVEPGIAPVPRATAHEVTRMAQEAVVNAIRHGGARSVSLSLSKSDGELKLQVGYEGRGFSAFSGTHDLAWLNEMKIGPGSLKERVSNVGGSLVIDSSETGARIEIAVPLHT